jgi:hypothetical protein
MGREIDQMKLLTEAMYAYKENAYNRAMWLKQIGVIVLNDADTPEERCKKVFDLLETVGVRLGTDESKHF